MFCIGEQACHRASRGGRCWWRPVIGRGCGDLLETGLFERVGEAAADLRQKIARAGAADKCGALTSLPVPAAKVGDECEIWVDDPADDYEAALWGYSAHSAELNCGTGAEASTLASQKSCRPLAMNSVKGFAAALLRQRGG